MNNRKLPQKIQYKLDEWMHEDDVIPTHFWEQDDTYFVLVLWDNDLYCLRFWESLFTEKVEVSQDNVIHLGEKK